MTPSLTVTGLGGWPEVRAGDDLAALVLAALAGAGLQLADGDVLVVSSKVVSKSLGLVAASSPREDVIAGQTRRVVAERLTPGGVTRVVEAVAGPVMAAAGVDASNAGRTGGLLLLPADPDDVAAALLRRLSALAALGGAVPDTAAPRVGLVLSDTAGRPWRVGQTDFALGSAGLVVAEDLRGTVDADGVELAVTVRAVADEVAAAADLVKGKADRVPAAHLRGLAHLVGGGAGAADLVRVGAQDWFSLGHVEAVRAALGVRPGTQEAAAAGIPSTLPEDRAAVVARCLRVALHGQGADIVAARADDRVTLAGPDAFRLGFVTSRLVTSLAAEGVGATVHRVNGAAEVRF
ncbi:MAG TPA: coenzyme F420-0:L-glutamate ligase [Dermatophilaceae bacterium]|nr:coenzyme F420-0:L-glutamate ligase [Dermatophilaceae bacterium]